MNHDLLDALYAARRELTRIIVATAVENVSTDSLQELLQQRDHIIWVINRILVSDLTSSLADVTKACGAIEDSTTQLKTLTSTAADVAKAISIANQVLGAAAGLA